MGTRKPQSATAPTEQSAEEAQLVALQLREIDGLLELVQVLFSRFLFWSACILIHEQDAPPEELVPALELLYKIFSAILDKPTEPKVAQHPAFSELYPT